MAGLYPVDQIVTIYGNEVMFPGLDPETHKFTNGDFSNPLIKPSFVPAETINLILDNLQTFIGGLGLTPNNTDPDQLLKALQDKYSTTEWLLNFLYPVGCSYKQNMNDLSPLERHLPGEWEIWSGRADGYELIFESLPSGIIDPDTGKIRIYTQSKNYPINTYLMYHYAGDDWTVYRSKEAITNAPQQLDPMKWDKLPNGIIIERRQLQDWGDDDFVIGDQVPGGTYAGWTLSGIIVPGGKFESIEGGNRPTYVSGGVTGEEKHTLTVAEMPSHTHTPKINLSVTYGAGGTGTYRYDSVSYNADILNNTGGNQQGERI